jgi:hypothetical protein
MAPFKNAIKSFPRNCAYSPIGTNRAAKVREVRDWELNVS